MRLLFPFPFVFFPKIKTQSSSSSPSSSSSTGVKGNQHPVRDPRPGRKYLLGKCQVVDLVDTDEFSVYELNAMMKEIGHTDDDVAHFTISKYLLQT
ncbi:hypothetical protein OSB04_001671 [Centaurea solstitialis]|uniref:Uncharacterized protein n=1 Tax=Centaurea solstitialis TaxID=347529 RepID=A0AA38U347_9ASTR|nr:hypothetical protein OSB04_001671 [Centaurea solstitialis]